MRQLVYRALAAPAAHLNRPAARAPPPQAGDSTGQKLGGSVINALIFVGIIAAMVGSAASLVGQSKQKTSWKPTNQPLTH
jgi:hypothetical protein